MTSFRDKRDLFSSLQSLVCNILILDSINLLVSYSKEKLFEINLGIFMIKANKLSDHCDDEF